MGLPIWRDPEESKPSKPAVERDLTAALRSSIRRRPARFSHGRYTDRSPPTHRRVETDSHRTIHRGVPPVSTLLESADRSSSLPIPPPSPLRPGVDEPTVMLVDPSGRVDPRALRTSNPSGDSTTPRAPFAERLSILRGSHRGSSPQPAATVRLHSRMAGAEEIRRQSRLARANESSGPSATPPIRAGDISRDPRMRHPPADTSGDTNRSFGNSRSREARNRLRRSWRSDYPINSLSDRDSSPNLTDGWEVMRTTITPDATLPSADSSFASAAAIHSFTSDVAPNSTEATAHSSAGNSQPGLIEVSQTETTFPLDMNFELVCDDAEMQATATVAEDMYFCEMNDFNGRERIARQQTLIAEHGNRFAFAGEPERVEVGFRLIDSALDSEEGRERVYQLSRNRLPNPEFITWLFGNRVGRRPNRREPASDDESPPVNVENQIRATIQHASEMIHGFLMRRTVDSLASRSASPPPQYEPVASQPDAHTTTSRDEPVAYPVSPPSSRSERELADVLYSGDEQDVNVTRRIVERLAQRDDVPDEWWMSMGLNLSRTQVRGHQSRSRSPGRHRTDGRDDIPAGTRVRSGRIERADSRL